MVYSFHRAICPLSIWIDALRSQEILRVSLRLFGLALNHSAECIEPVGLDISVYKLHSDCNNTVLNVTSSGFPTDVF